MSKGYVVTAAYKGLGSGPAGKKNPESVKSVLEGALISIKLVL